MNKLSVLFMKIVRKFKNVFSNWYRRTAFISGLKSHGDKIGLLGDVYLWNDNVSIGSGTNVYHGVTLWGPRDIIIGENVELGINTVIYSQKRVKIGSNVSIAANCYIIDSNHGIEKNELIRNQRQTVKGPVIIDDDVWLGAGGNCS